MVHRNKIDYSHYVTHEFFQKENVKLFLNHVKCPLKILEISNIIRFGRLWFGGIGSAEPPNLAKLAEFGRTETEPNSSVAH